MSKLHTPLRKPFNVLLAVALATGCLPAAAGVVSVTVTDKAGVLVQNAVVVVTTKTPHTVKSQWNDTAVVNQTKMKFQPALTILPVGGKVTFVNNDPWEHHVRASAAGIAQFLEKDAGGGFSMVLDGKPEGKPAKFGDFIFAKAGAVHLGCYLHSAMSAYIYVTNSPWTQTTDTTGRVVFNDVPDGPAEIKVWIPELLQELPPVTAMVGAKPLSASIQLKVNARRRTS